MAVGFDDDNDYEYVSYGLFFDDELVLQFNDDFLIHIHYADLFFIHGNPVYLQLSTYVCWVLMPLGHAFTSCFLGIRITSGEG